MSRAKHLANLAAQFVLTLAALSGEPLPPFTTKHFAAMSDHRGISEFAQGTTPIRDRFCIEDAARALIAILKIHDLAPTDETTRLARLYLASIAGLQEADGRLHFGYRRQDGPMSRMAQGDQLARTLWCLGHAGVHGVDAAMCARAQDLFEKTLPHLKTNSGNTIEMSYAVQGLHLHLQAKPEATAASRALRSCADHLLENLPRDPANPWQWPHEVVTYDSARLPLALLLAFETTRNNSYRDAGLRVFAFLSTINFPGDGTTLHLIGNRGWYRRGRSPARLDQQPLDASSLVEAASAAWRITGDESWRTRAQTAFAWFTGNNSAGVAIYDPESGGCRDGLGRDRANPNQGAESTASYWIARCEIETLSTE